MLVAIEGIDGVGKSTQVDLLAKTLNKNGYRTLVSRWNSDEYVKSATSALKKERAIDPRTYCLLHAADLSTRFSRHIEPALRAGSIVICDRYVETALSRDGARGMADSYVRMIYQDFPAPTVSIYLDSDPSLALSRIKAGGGKPSYYEAGLDIFPNHDRESGFIAFQGRVRSFYRDLSPLSTISATESIQSIAQKIWAIVSLSLAAPTAQESGEGDNTLPERKDRIKY